MEESNRRLLRARDAMDRNYARPLDIESLARVAHVSEAHFIRSFRATFGETPHRYLQRRRVERSMFLLRETSRSVTEVCLDIEAVTSFGLMPISTTSSSSSRSLPSSGALVSPPTRSASSIQAR